MIGTLGAKDANINILITVKLAKHFLFITQVFVTRIVSALYNFGNYFEK